MVPSETKFGGWTTRGSSKDYQTALEVPKEMHELATGLTPSLPVYGFAPSFPYFSLYGPSGELLREDAFPALLTRHL